MNITRRLKRAVQAIVPPLLFLSLVGYFLWQATQGEHGLESYAIRQNDLVAAQAELARSDQEVTSWERRVAALRTSRLDRDSLDERSRAMLNLSEPSDVIILYGNGQRLF